MLPIVIKDDLNDSQSLPPRVKCNLDYKKGQLRKGSLEVDCNWRENMRDKFIKCHKNEFGKKDYNISNDKSALSSHINKIL